ncbi:MAG TPA: bifunctional YncE family protein/alkaline phosphatase family protein [Gemmatimonadaceae bacterium]|nr:bifunctional YncE family protein/alkaline phosphatase family protein [Gemmatimonadaceae bacterium]
MRVARLLSTAFAVAACGGCHSSPNTPDAPNDSSRRLPTGLNLDPAGTAVTVGQMPLAMTLSPDGRQVVLLLNGYLQTGVQIVDRSSGRVGQTLPQRTAFLGLAFSPDGRWLWASGGNLELVYRYAWADGRATLSDSIPLGPPPAPHASGIHYPAGIAPSNDGAMLYVAENLSDDVAVLSIAERRVVQRLPTQRYPYAVVVAPDGTVYVSAWGGNTVSVFSPGSGGRLTEVTRIAAGRHPSALLLSRDGSRLFVASASTDRVAVVDTRARTVVTELRDPPPSGPGEGSTPNALALAPDGRRLYVAEADNNAVAVFALSSRTAGLTTAGAAPDSDRLVARVPVEWYPAALAASGDSLIVANAKGHGTAANPAGPNPLRGYYASPRDYTLGQLTGSLTTVIGTDLAPDKLPALTARVAAANGWTRSRAGPAYPPFEHVIYVIKENRTYDQVLGDLPRGDGDTSLVFFPRAVGPNHHALAERFGIFDRFFVNSETSADGHNWATAAYAPDYVEKTVQPNYSGNGRDYDFEGLNRGETVEAIPDDDVDEPANGYLWTLAQAAKISFRNYGEYVVEDSSLRTKDLPVGYRGTKPYLHAHTAHNFPGFDLAIPDQRRADLWIADLGEFEKQGSMPQLQILRLPNDHTAARRPGLPTPRACFADNDLALGRVVEALSRSRFWKSTVMFVLEDDSQNGPDHVDSHRSPLLVISPYNKPGVVHRFANTTDVIATIAEILRLGSLSQFDFYGRPLRGIFASTADTTPYVAQTPAVSLDERNPTTTGALRESKGLDLRLEDRIDDETFNRILWAAIKGDRVPYPAATRMSALEARRAR